LTPEDRDPEFRGSWPAVNVVIPARDEALALPETLPTVLAQDYPGSLRVFLVDDHSTDGTADVAAAIARSQGGDQRFALIIKAAPLPAGWTGKVWALQQGVQMSATNPPKFWLFTDADISHPPDNLGQLVNKALTADLDLVSLMVRLRTAGPWERLLIPAFVYFFAKLYPFRWVNDPRKRTAAAAGGCVLLRNEALERSGGLEAVAGELIDDCALARQIKRRGRTGGGRIWLGLTRSVRSVRSYEGLRGVWEMVARAAFTQLHHSTLLLLGTVAGMLLVYLGPVAVASWGLFGGLAGPELTARSCYGTMGLAAWVLMGATYVPMLRWNGLSPGFAPLMPGIAFLYTLMTVDSALRFWRGKGGYWKGRAAARSGAATNPRSAK
jgi:hopene-associated glycosyltransferase HpnB